MPTNEKYWSKFLYIVEPLYRAFELKLECPAMGSETIYENAAVPGAILVYGAVRRHMDMTRQRYSKNWEEAGK